MQARMRLSEAMHHASQAFHPSDHMKQCRPTSLLAFIHHLLVALYEANRQT